MALKTNQMHTDFAKYWGNFDSIFAKSDGKNDGKSDKIQGISKDEFEKQDKGIFKVNRYE